MADLAGLWLHFVGAGVYLDLSSARLYNYLVIFPGMYGDIEIGTFDTIELLSGDAVIDTVTWTYAAAYPGESYRKSTGQGTWYWGVNPSIGRANP